MNVKETEEKKVAFQGELGAFSNEAARKLLGSDVPLFPCRSFDEMFAAVERGEAAHCLAPIENSLFGSVYQNYDLLLRHQLCIIGEVNLRIVHNLIGPPGLTVDHIRRVYSHPVALAQCQRFLSNHPEIEQMTGYDTAGSVKMLMETREPGSAAIAGASAARAYGAEILITGVEDDPQNYTRFWLLSRSNSLKSPEATANKTSIVFALENRTGSLFKALAVFALRDIDLMKIESRPLIGSPWEYSFYLDFSGHTDDARVKAALANLSEFASRVRVLGCYERARPEGDMN